MPYPQGYQAKPESKIYCEKDLQLSTKKENSKLKATKQEHCIKTKNMSTEQELKQLEALNDADREEKKELVLKTISEYCTVGKTEFADLNAIGARMNRGEKLSCSIISGGKTNYSYKVFFPKDGEKNPVLYAKLAFNYALWNPDRTVKYDLQRTINEFEMMETFAKAMGGAKKAHVATPYFMVDVKEDVKLFVTEWVATDEQFANQFIDGTVDTRVVKGLGQTIAALNLQPVDPSWNDNVRPTLASLFPAVKQEVLDKMAAVPYESADFALKLAKDMGSERYANLVETQRNELLECREVLCHNDFHQFNMLVEQKPDVENMDQFGKSGDFVLCDWEMSIMGPLGKDVGLFQAWPIACAMAHAAQGHKDVALSLLQCNIDFFDAYAQAMVEQGSKDEAYLEKAFRQSLPSTGLFLFYVLYCLGIFIENLPLQDVNEETIQEVKATIGYIGFQFISLYDEKESKSSYSLTELRGWYKDLVESQIDKLTNLASAQEGQRPRPRLSRRRSSVLRSAPHRVSDASVVEHARKALVQDASVRRLLQEDRSASFREIENSSFIAHDFK